jgi:hypothetical protein
MAREQKNHEESKKTITAVPATKSLNVRPEPSSFGQSEPCPMETLPESSTFDVQPEPSKSKSFWQSHPKKPDSLKPAIAKASLRERLAVWRSRIISFLLPFVKWLRQVGSASILFGAIGLMNDFHTAAIFAVSIGILIVLLDLIVEPLPTPWNIVVFVIVVLAGFIFTSTIVFRTASVSGNLVAVEDGQYEVTIENTSPYRDDYKDVDLNIIPNNGMNDWLEKVTVADHYRQSCEINDDSIHPSFRVGLSVTPPRFTTIFSSLPTTAPVRPSKVLFNRTRIICSTLFPGSPIYVRFAALKDKHPSVMKWMEDKMMEDKVSSVIIEGRVHFKGQSLDLITHVTRMSSSYDSSQH